MNPQALKAELLRATAQVIVFDTNGKLLSSCDSIFKVPNDAVANLYNSIPILESLQQSFAELKLEEEIKLPCIWFESFNVSGYFDLTFIKKENAIVWLIQDFDKLYKSQIRVQQERNESIISSELIELHRKTQEKLRKIEKEYKDLFDNTLDLIQSIDADGKFIFTNPAWQNTLKYSEEELSDMTFLEIVHKEDVLHCEQLFRSLNNKNQLKDVEVRFVAKDGKIIYVQGTINSTIRHGKLVLSQGIFKDVTEKKRAEIKLQQSEALYRLLVENASDIIFMTNNIGEITYMNNVGLKFTGSTQDKVKKVDFLDWVHLDYRAKTKEFYKNQLLKRQRSTYLEFPVSIRKNTIWVGQNVNLLFDVVDNKEYITGFLVVVRDITKQKELADALGNANEILNQKVKKRTLELSETNIKLNQLNTDLDSFLYRSSHNLKGPVARIKGLINILGMDGEKENMADHLRYINNELLNLNQLTNQLTTYHIIYSTNDIENIENIEIHGLLESIITSLEITGLQYNISVDSKFNLVCNKELLTIALTTLLENAIQFRKDSNKNRHQITVVAKPFKRWVEISVEDTGEGIVEEIHDSIFNMFYKGSLKSKGNGLGLYLAKKAVDKLAGKISVVSKKNEYTKFMILLPKNINKDKKGEIISRK